MKTKFTLLFIFISISNFVTAQDFCATSSNSQNQNYTSLSRMLYANAKNEEMLCLNIYFHIVRKNDGSGGISSYETNGIIDDLNGNFNVHNIMFNKLGQDYIDNTTLNNIDYPSEKQDLIALNNVTDAINFYIVDDATFNGWAENVPGKNLIIKAVSALTNVSSHEIGHCLNLWHTHHGHPIAEPNSSDPNLCEELIDGTNGSICGDFVRDTPADSGLRDTKNTQNPNYPYYVDNNCNYTKNDGYNPDTKNIMSYSSPSCLTHFTNQQAIRMRDAILNKPILQSAISCSCSAPVIYGNSTICSDETATYSIPCANATYATSSNLQILTSTNNSITVKPINTSINGEAYVNASINGSVLHKDIWIGKPKVNIDLFPDTNYVFMEMSGINSDMHKQNITYIKWEKISSTGNPVMGSAINSFENLAHGNNTNWSIEALIKIANTCDTTYVYKTITPPAPSPCRSYEIIKTKKNEYNAFKIIDPCSKTTFNKESEKLKDIEITKAELYDIYGMKVKSFKINSFETFNLKKGIYIFKVQITNEIVTQKIIVE